MDSQRWKRIEEILDRVLDADPAVRHDILEEACGDDAILKAEVRALLSRKTASDGLLDGSAREAFQATDQFVGPTAADTDFQKKLGRYRLKGILGRGGMGTVFEAERADGEYEQRVAIKLLATAVTSDLAKSRFKQERQILARLDHSGIARLLDGGTTEDDRQYLVMELVDGVSIDKYCDSNRLSITDRIKLFVAVCRAVQFAHTNLVVHRDLKPSNILVTDAGVPKLLDFGIAKLLDDTVDAATLTGQQAMTPEYASPEQVRGESITTATDVYSLGVLLYELLTGTKPYEVRSQPVREIERLICEVDPPRPSTAVIAVGEDASRFRATRPDKLHKRLVGDLDMVIGKAMAKDPERRYLSAGDLARDLLRHLSGLPVEASGDTLGYRTRKFVRRHRVGVLSGFMIFLALAGGMGVALWQASVARGERDLAQLERAKAEKVTEFISGIFENASPENAQGDTLNVFELVELGGADVDSALQSQPKVLASMLSVLGTVNLALDRPLTADSLFRRSYEIRSIEYESRNPEVARGLFDMAKSAMALGDLLRADSLAENAYNVIASTAGRGDELAVSALGVRANVQYSSANFAAAETLLTELVRLADLDPDFDRDEYLSLLNNRANSIYNQGRYLEAAEVLRIIMEERIQLLGPDHPGTASSLRNYASTLNRAEQFGDAARHARQALAIQQRIFSPDHTDIPWTLFELSDAMKGMGKIDSAYQYVEDALAIQNRSLTPGHPDLVVTHSLLASIAFADQDNPRAYLHARNQRDAAALAYGDSTVYVIASTLAMSRALIAQGMGREAVGHLKPTCRWLEKNRPTDQGRNDQCAKLSEQALDLVDGQ